MKLTPFDAQCRNYGGQINICLVKILRFGGENRGQSFGECVTLSVRPSVRPSVRKGAPYCAHAWVPNAIFLGQFEAPECRTALGFLNFSLVCTEKNF